MAIYVLLIITYMYRVSPKKGGIIVFEATFERLKGPKWKNLRKQTPIKFYFIYWESCIFIFS